MLKTSPIALLPLLNVRTARDSAGRTTRLAFAFSFVFLAFYVVKHVPRVPLHDEFSHAIFLYAEPTVPFSRYWDQHNEHRIPLPRILYFTAVRLTGNDFRAPPILNVLKLGGAVAFLLHAIKRIRGSYSLADAVLPLGLLTIGQYGNLLWGFQVQFIASVCLTIVAVGIVASPNIAASPGRIAALGMCGILLPLCGMNGVAFAPGIAVGLLLVGALNLRSRTGWVAILFGAAVLAVTVAYFRGYVEPPHHAKGHGSLTEMAIGTVNLLGASFGPVVRWLPPQPHDGLTAFGVLAALLVAATGWLLLRAACDPARRSQALLLGGVLIGFLGLAAGIAKGRAGHTNVLEPNRYVSLMLPMLAGIYVAWTVFGFSRLPKALAVLVAACAIPNAIIGWNEANLTTYEAKRVEFDVKAGLPLEFIADRNLALYREEAHHRRNFLELLRRNGVAPFRDIAPTPKVNAEPVSLRIVRLEDAIEVEGGFQTTADIGGAVFALPRRQHVYGFKLIYTAEAGERKELPNVISWAPGGERPALGVHGTLNQIEVCTEPAETLAWVQCEAETVRVDLFGRGARMRIFSLEVLTLPP